MNIHHYLPLAVLSLLQLTKAWQCSCGYYCPDSVQKYKDPKICPVGSYCLQGGYNKTSQPYNCTAGRLCPIEGLCRALPCPCGYFCPPRSSAPIKCGKATFCPQNSSKPIDCHPGECPYEGMCSKLKTTTAETKRTTAIETISTTQSGKCPEPTCDPSNPPPGYLCFNDPSYGCGLFCFDETYCPVPTASMPVKATATIPNPVPWPTTPRVYTCGYYVDKGSSREVPCRPGKYCPTETTSTGTTAPITPVPCPAGYYCAVGACRPTPCPCGYKCPAGSSAGTLCQPPYHCPGPLASTQTLCPIGHACDRPGMCNATACPPGTFVSCPGKRSCDRCPAGRFCAAPTSSALCPVGYYCPAGSSAPALCPAGHYCRLGSAEPAACEGGAGSDPGAGSARQCGRRR